MNYKIMVAWKNGDFEYLKRGDGIAFFESRREADEQVELMEAGMDEDEYQSITVVPHHQRPGIRTNEEYNRRHE